MHERSESAIQRPDIIHRLQQFLGLRQWSVVPRLLEGVQAVVIMGDVREVADEKVVARPCAGTVQGISEFLGFHVAVTLVNPIGSGVVVRIEEFESGLASKRVLLEEDGTSIGFPQPTAFRDLAAPGPLPRAQLSSSGVAGYPGLAHYVFQLPMGGRNLGTAWTLFPGWRLRLDSNEALGSTTPEDFSFLWTESTLRSS